jgi:hypothetical protein
MIAKMLKSFLSFVAGINYSGLTAQSGPADKTEKKEMISFSSKRTRLKN